MSLDSTKESLYVTMRLLNKDYLQAYKVQNRKKPTDVTHYLPFLEQQNPHTIFSLHIHYKPELLSSPLNTLKLPFMLYDCNHKNPVPET